MGPVELWGKQYTMGRLRLLLMAEWSCRDTQKTLLKTIVMGHPLGATTKSFPASLPRIPIILPSPILCGQGQPIIATPRRDVCASGTSRYPALKASLNLTYGENMAATRATRKHTATARLRTSVGKDSTAHREHASQTNSMHIVPSRFTARMIHG